MCLPRGTILVGLTDLRLPCKPEGTRSRSIAADHIPRAILSDPVTAVQGSIEKLPDPKDVFHALYHHFLCLADPALHAPPGASPLPSGSSGQLTVGSRLTRLTSLNFVVVLCMA